MATLILAALLAVYIILGILYESLVHPITIISTLPSAGLGALLSLEAVRRRIHRHRLHRHSAADRHREEERHHARRLRACRPNASSGLSVHDAALEAARERFRPILMTTLAAMFGALPLAFASGIGAELRRPLGITIVGGSAAQPGADALHDAGHLSADEQACGASRRASAGASRR